MQQANKLKINLLGQPSIMLGNEDLTLKRKSLAVFAYLVSLRGKISRKELCKIFWPEQSVERSQNNLRVLLHRLPTQLKDQLEINYEGVTFKSHNVFLDRDKFNDHLQTVDQIYKNEKQLSKTGLTIIENALNLYRGEFLESFFLDGNSQFMGWLVQERETIRDQAFNGASLLLAHYYDRSNYEKALGIINELLRIDPLNEDAHMAKMKVWVALNDVGQALVHFRMFQDLLRKEVSANPSQAISTYYRELMYPELVPDEQRTQPADFKLLNLKPTTVPSTATAPSKSEKSAADAADDVQKQKSFKPIPNVVTTLFGRTEFVTDLRKRLLKIDNRLITLIGMGGIGKTQVALTTGHLVRSDFKDGVVYVPLRHIKREPLVEGSKDPAEIEKRISQQLSSKTLESMNAHGQPAGDSLFFQLIDTLGRQDILLIYDNFEHLIEGASFFTSLLHSVANITILVTSRTRLGQPGEMSLLVPPLSHTVEIKSGEQTEVLETSSIKLFVDRATRLNSQLTFNAEDIQIIETICQLAGGHPLAIEHAASWVLHFSLEEIAQEMSKSISFLENMHAPANDQHRSVSITLESSFNLLDETEKQTLFACSLFHHEFSRESALTVAGSSMLPLISLVDRNLIQQVEPGWYSLHPLVAQMARGRHGEWDPVQKHQARNQFVWYFLNFIAELERNETLSKKFSDAFRANMIRMKEDTFQAWNWAVLDKAYASLAKLDKTVIQFFRLSGTENFRVHVLYEWTLKELKAAVPSHLRTVELAPPHYIDFLTQVIYESSKFCSTRGEFDKEKAYLEENLKLLDGSDYHKTHAYSAVGLCLAILWPDPTADVEGFVQLTKKLIPKVTQPIDQIYLGIQLTGVYEYQGNLKLAVEENTKLLNSIDNKYPSVRQYLGFLIASNYRHLKDYEKTLALLEESFKDVEDVPRNMPMQAKLLKAKALFRLNRIHESIDCLGTLDPHMHLFYDFFDKYDHLLLFMLEKLGLYHADPSFPKSALDFRDDAKRLGHILSRTNEETFWNFFAFSSIHFVALAAGEALYGYPTKAKEALQKGLSALKKRTKPADKNLVLSLLIFLIHALFYLEIDDLIKPLITFLSKGSHEEYGKPAYLRLLTIYEAHYGEPFEPLPAADVPQTPEEVVALLLTLESEFAP